MAWAMAAVFVLVVAAGVLGNLRMSGLSSELGHLKERQDAAIRQIDDFKDRYPPPSPDPDLTVVNVAPDIKGKRKFATRVMDLIEAWMT